MKDLTKGKPSRLILAFAIYGKYTPAHIQYS